MIFQARILTRTDVQPFQVSARDIDAARLVAKVEAVKVHGVTRRETATLMLAPVFDHAAVHSVDDFHPNALPHPFWPDTDTGQPPEGTACLFHIDHGRVVIDRHGRRFRLMGAGAVQGTVTLRDNRRRLFYAAGDQLMRAVD